MNYYCSTVNLIYLIVAFMTGSCCCQRKKQPYERKAQVNVPTVTCSSRGMRAVFDPTVKSNVHVKDFTGALIPLPESDEFCGVKVSKEKNKSISIFSRYDSCYAIFEGNNVIIPLQVQLKGQDRWIRVNISCPLIKRRSERTHTHPTPFPGNCDSDRALRLDCGVGSVSAEACNNLGCCYDVHQVHCYHRLDACSVDGHFVFSVKAKDSHPPIDPRSLVVKNQPHCLPEITTADIAIFKIRITECGAKMQSDGDMLIYEVEVVEMPDTERETLHSPFSLQVQCEYEALDAKRAAELQPLYALTNPPPVVALGTIKVQMRIATDPSFTSFIPEDQLPLTVALRDTVNVEISIVQPFPDPSLSLFVRDCFAYPASRHSVWTLLYDGCPNPVDNMRSSIPVDNQGKTTSHSQVRRFDVKTFAFLEPDSGNPSAEEVRLTQ
uniref:Zona pellucida sperm-binding protein 4-like n=1 Tax=Gouania willdenowi TaxID=441366 RepID=A0A8C5G2A9_GOUWI